MADMSPFAMAGLWEFWIEPGNGTSIHSFAILTVRANELLASIRNRMPVILHPSNWNLWLGAAPPAAAQELLRPYPAREMKAYPISTRVNSPDYDDPAILKPMGQGLAVARART